MIKAASVAALDGLRRTRAYAWRKRLQAARAGGARIEARPRPAGMPAGDGPTFAMVCGGLFDQSVPNAATTCRVGWCNGFEALGVPAAMVNALALERELAALARPFCWVAASDYAYLDRRQLAALARYPHAVLVDPWFKGEQAYWSRHGYPVLHNPAWLRTRVLSTQPRFLFTFSPESSVGYYEGWTRTGLAVHSLPLACDTDYYGDAARGEAGAQDADMVFVGGYWPYKARQFDQYLKPYADRLRVFGYSAWPYGRYGGQLARDAEAGLYARARISPVINEPHASAMGVDLNERVFKVLGSGGLAITDASPGYRDWFSADELLVPRSLAEYHDMVDAAWRDPAQLDGVRQRGVQAVLRRHTYQHRAQRFASLMSVAIAPVG